MGDKIEIPKHYADMFAANVFYKSQQVRGALAPYVRLESHTAGAETVFYDAFTKTRVNKRTERAAQTKLVEVDRDRRCVRADWYDWATVIDKLDTAKTIHKPDNPLVNIATWAFTVNKDEIVYEAALGTAYAGRKGLDAVTLPLTQKVAAFDPANPLGGNGMMALNIATLARVKRKFADNDIGTQVGMYPGAGFHIAVKPAQIESMLNDPMITTIDRNSVKALVRGEIDSFMGFTFHQWTGIEVTNTAVRYMPSTGEVVTGTPSGSITNGTDFYARCFAWYTDGILLSVGQGLRTKISERNDLSHVKQIYMDAHLGATRMEEEKVVEVLVLDA